MGAIFFVFYPQGLNENTVFPHSEEKPLSLSLRPVTNLCFITQKPWKNVHMKTSPLGKNTMNGLFAFFTKTKFAIFIGTFVVISKIFY